MAYATMNNARFYEDRFASGYMEVWPDEKKERVCKLIKSLGLSETGKALDFGCGNGVFTNILIKALPKWEIFGTDISKIAILNAKKQVPQGFFFHIDDILKNNNKFDFVFTHHVLEHLCDIESVFKDITSIMNPICASMLHIMPCGNKGSLEYNICAVRQDGIDGLNKRFFFEDDGHVRRYTSDSIVKLALKHGFELKEERFANQYYGAVRWIAHSGLKTIFKLTQVRGINSINHKLRMFQLRFVLIFFSLTTRRIKSVNLRKNKVGEKKLKDSLLILLSMPFFIFFPIYYWLEKKTEDEWDINNSDKNGSEMYLCFEKNQEDTKV